MPSALTDYLTSHYLTASTLSPNPSNPKKRKRKDPSKSKSNTGITFEDDDLSGFIALGDREDDERDAPTTAQGRTAEFRRKKGGGFKPVAVESGNGPSREGNANEEERVSEKDDDADAEAIINAAAQHNSTRTQEREDEAPAIVDDDNIPQEVTSKSSKSRRKRQKSDPSPEPNSEQTQTIYRDASGRIINLSAARAAANKTQLEANQRALEKKEAVLAPAQRVLKSQRAQDLKDARLMTVARYADDEGLNAELKERERWNDPAAGFLSEKKSGGGGRGGARGRKAYKGAHEPNRYGIKPGWRWDGVDRGNGHERKRFAAINRKEDVKNLNYAWEMDE